MLVNSAEKAPSVSVALPVYNGERYLRQTIECLLKQDYQDIELVISDNASSDSTQQIALDYARSDRRVKYFRNRRNLGVHPNFNLAFRRCRGEYFKWAAHDDLYAPNFLSHCVDVLDHDASVALCFTRFLAIDEHGAVTAAQPWTMNLLGDRPHQRFRQFLSDGRGHSALFGLIRSDMLRKTRLLANYWGADRALLAELSLHGRFVEVPEPLFFWRDHPGRSPYSSDRVGFTDTRRRGRPDLMHLEHALNYARILTTAQIGPAEKLLCLVGLLRAVQDRAGELGPVIGREFVTAWRQVLRSRR